MAKLKILHTADWHHGDFPGPGDGNENGRAKDNKNVLSYIVSQAEHETPDVIIVSGDLFHQAKTWCDRALSEVRTIQSVLLLLADIPSVKAVVVVKGTANHDGKEHFETLKTMTANNEKIHIVNGEITDTPVCITVDGLCQIICIPAFDKTVFDNGVSKMCDSADVLARNSMLSDVLHQQIRKGLRLTDGSLPTVLATHFTVTGCKNENGFTNSSLSEPVIDPSSTNGYDLVCLGHIHEPQQVIPDGNIFYAGAPMQLTFNDEGQPRGFYIHEYDGTKFVSEFHTVDPKTYHQFFTLRFDNAQIEDIIAGNYDESLIGSAVVGRSQTRAPVSAALPSSRALEGKSQTRAPVSAAPPSSRALEGKIVRVLYSCDADTQINLNKALLEKAILTAGAWFVDSISAEELRVRTSKKSVVSTDTPIDILQSWLKDHQPAAVQNIDIESCLTLAEPLIDRVAANLPKMTQQGVFTPKRIAVKNYRHYADTEFNYDSVSFCVINGKNGTGKSSLFMDAMLTAIFEDTREGDIKAWISNKAQVRSGSIVFEFFIGESVYKISRTRTKSGKAKQEPRCGGLCPAAGGLTTKLTLNVFALEPNDSWIDLSKPNTRDTQALIEQIIGIDVFTLKSCGLIMQADYGAFLQADRSAKMSVLADILGLGIYEHLLKETVNEATEIGREITKLQSEKATLLDSQPEVALLEGELGQLKKSESMLVNKKADYEKLRVQTADEISSLRNTFARNSQLRQEIHDLTSAVETKRKAVQTLTDELTLANNNIANADSYERDYNAHVAAVEREKNLIHQQTLQSMHAANRKRAEAMFIVAEMVIKETQNEMSELSKECSDDNIAALQRDVQECERISSELENIKAKEADLLGWQNAHTARYERFKTYYAAYEANQKANQDAIDRLESEIERLKNSGCLDFDNADCEFIKAAKTAPGEIAKIRQAQAKKDAEYNTELSASKAETDSFEAQIKIIREFLATKEKEALTARQQELADVQTRLTAAQNAKQNMESAKGRLEYAFAQKGEQEALIREADTALAEILQNCSDVRGDLASEIIAARNVIHALAPTAAMWQHIPVLREKVNSMGVRIANENSALGELEMSVAAKQKEQSGLFTPTMPDAETLAAGLSEKLEVLASCEGDSKTTDSQIARNAREQGSLNTKLELAQANQKRINEISDTLSDYSKLDACYNLLKTAFSKNGITHSITRKCIPALETVSGQILGDMTGNTLGVRFVLDKELKNKKEVTTLDVFIDDNSLGGTGSLAYMSRSGGERVKSALAVILALAELKASQCGTQLGFLFIDEPPFLDSGGVNAYCDALEAIRQRYPDLKIMAVTHDEEMKTRFPQNIFVYRDDTGSRFIADL